MALTTRCHVASLVLVLGVALCPLKASLWHGHYESALNTSIHLPALDDRYAVLTHHLAV